MATEAEPRCRSLPHLGKMPRCWRLSEFAEDTVLSSWPGRLFSGGI